MSVFRGSVQSLPRSYILINYIIPLATGNWQLETGNWKLKNLPRMLKNKRIKIMVEQKKRR